MFILWKESECLIPRKRENVLDKMSLWCAPTIEKKVSIFNVRALITCEIMHNKDVQCNTA